MDPTLGFLNIGGEGLAPLMEEDRATLSPLFSKIEIGTGYQIPRCDVLFVYADVSADGSVGLGNGVTFRHLAEKSGATIAVLASNNNSEVISAAAKLSGPKQANLVWTLNQRGSAFATFFKELFSRMKKGRPMPSAWVTIAPQHKAEGHHELPETMCQMEAGQVRFR